MSGNPETDGRWHGEPVEAAAAASWLQACSLICVFFLKKKYVLKFSTDRPRDLRARALALPCMPDTKFSSIAPYFKIGMPAWKPWSVGLLVRMAIGQAVEDETATSALVSVRDRTEWDRSLVLGIVSHNLAVN
eukprot:SAG31_NODE_7803_length_1593_cov_1.990629_1_plen_133_part_00